MDKPIDLQLTRARIDYHGKASVFARLLAKGWLLALVTLGIYRFWLITDARRYLWSHTDIDGDQLEYTGRGKELLIGFLIALAIFVPLNIALSLAAFAGTWANVIALFVYFGLLMVLVPFAMYRARRYRLTRTTHRSIRLGLAGSGTAYALRWVGWWMLTIVTLGFAYPWQQAALERYAIGNTYYGNLRARFTGTGGQLFKSTLLIQLVCVGPMLVVVVLIAQSGIVGDVIAGNFEFRTADNGLIFLEGASKYYGGILTGAIFWMVFSSYLLYPLYRTIEFRWWTAGIRLDKLAIDSTLGSLSVYGMYLRYLGMLMLIGTVLSIIAVLIGLVVGILYGAGTFDDLAGLAQNGSYTTTTTVLVVMAYLIAAIAFAVAHQIIVWAGFWRLAAHSITISGHEVLREAKAAQPQSGAFGEGLADALDIGGF